jgi:hypothetical protein
MNRHRDILLLMNQNLMSPQSLENQVSVLHNILFQAEQWPNVTTVTEVMDLNQYRIIRKSHQVKRYFKTKFESPFIFFVNRN